MLRCLDKQHDLPAQRPRQCVEFGQRLRLVGQFGRQIGRHRGFARVALQLQRHLYCRSRVNAQLAPDAAVHVQAIASTARRHQRALHRQPFDPPAHRNMQGLAARRLANRLGNVARQIDAAQDPDFLDARRKRVRVFPLLHARLYGFSASSSGIRDNAPA